MHKPSSIPVLVAATALLACLGCSGSVDRTDRQPPTVGGAPAPSGSASAPSAAAPAPVPAGATGGVAHGKLRSWFSSSARADICVATDAGGRISAIDEYECEPLTDDALGPRAWCAGCEISFLHARDGSWMLTASDTSESCSAFAATYLLDQDPQACEAELGSREPGCPANAWWLCEE